MKRKRYAVQFTPVGWHVVDTIETRDPAAQYGLGTDEYRRARAECERLNAQTTSIPREGS